MAKIESLEILIQANADQLKSELQATQGLLKGFQKSVESSSTSVQGSFVGGITKGTIVANILMGTVQKLTSSITNQVKAVVSAGSSYSRMKVATDVVARNLGMTKIQVDGLRDSLAESNTYGIKAEEVIKSLALSGLVKMSEELEAVDARTNKMIKGTNALVLVMKDLAAVSGRDSSEGINRVTKFIQTGNASFVDGMIELGNLGTEYRMFAKTLGKSRGDLTALEEAQARTNIVMREGGKVAGAYAQTYETSGKQIGSIGDAIQSIREIVGGSLEPIFATLGKGTLSFLMGIRDMMGRYAGDIQKFGIRVAGTILAIIRTIGALLSRIPVIGKFFNGMANLSLKSMTTTASAIDGTAGSMDNASESAGKLKKKLMGLAGFDEMNVLSSPESGSGDGGAGVDVGGINPADFGIGDETLSEVNKFADNIGKSWKGMIDNIKNKWNELVENIKKNPFIQKIVDSTQGLRDEVMKLIDNFKEVWQMTGMSQHFSKALEVIGSIISAVIGGALYFIIEGWRIQIKLINNTIDWLKKMLVQGIKTFLDIRNWINTVIGVVGNLRDRLVQAFSSPQNAVNTFISLVSNKVNGLKSVFGILGSTLASLIKVPMNAVIDSLNRFFNTLRGVKIPDWVPGVGGKGFSLPNIPKLAQGGVVSSPTIAMVGEAGKEVVMPLERNTEWISQLAQQINNSGGQPTQLIVNVGGEKLYEQTIDYIKDKSLRTNVNLLGL
jgi:hypothetical protein